METLAKASAIIPKIGGIFSCTGSLLILRDICIKWKKKRSLNMTTRIMCGLSISDFFSSFFTYLMSTWMVPRYSGAYLASGTTASCVAQGFMTQLFVGLSLIYTSVLSITYWLIVQRGWKEDYMGQLKIKLLFLFPPIILCATLAILPLLDDAYNFANTFTCYITGYPYECNAPESEVECIRGANAKALKNACAFILSLVAILTNTTFVVALVYAVFRCERRMDAYTARGERRSRKNTIKTAWQGIFYIGSFAVTFTPFYLTNFIDAVGKPVPLVIEYLHIITIPLQGFFNALVYFRPRYMSARENNPSMSRWDSFLQTLDIDPCATSRFRWRSSRQRSHLESCQSDEVEDVCGLLANNTEDGNNC